VTKGEFRGVCLKKFKGAHAATKRKRSALLNHHLASVLQTLKPKTVLGYWPMEFEGDVKPTLLYYRRFFTVFLPFMDGVSFKMVPLRLPLERKAFGIYEPRASFRNINKIDVAIVPVVGVDHSFGRIGFGKGMYDRFFPTLKNKPYTIFIQPEKCVSRSYLCDDYDIRGDLLITPCGVYSPKDLKNVRRTTRRRWRRHP